MGVATGVPTGRQGVVARQGVGPASHGDVGEYHDRVARLGGVSAECKRGWQRRPLLLDLSAASATVPSRVSGSAATPVAASADVAAGLAGRAGELKCALVPLELGRVCHDCGLELEFSCPDGVLDRMRLLAP